MAILADRFAGALSRIDGDRELFDELATCFIEDAPKLLKSAKRGVAERDAEAVIRAVHGLRGLASTFDAEEAVGLSKSIELSASRGDWPAVGGAIGRLEIETNALRDALDGYTGR